MARRWQSKRLGDPGVGVTGEARRDPGEFECLQLAPGEEAAHHTAIGATGGGIGNPGAEELIGSKEGVAAGALQDGRDRSVRIEDQGSGQKSSLCSGSLPRSLLGGRF